jgi:hypothetical protein
MSSRSKVVFILAAALVLAAPAKRAAVTRSTAAVAADTVFWDTFHGARYDRIQNAIEVLAQAYVASPDDALTAGHLGWMHIWRISERARLESAPAAITAPGSSRMGDSAFSCVACHQQ